MSRRRIPVPLIVLYVVALLPLLAWPFIALVSAFAFDAPGSAQDPAVWRTVGAVLAYPLLPVAGVPVSFFAYRGGRRALAFISLGAALLPVLTFVVGLASILFADLLVLLGVRL